MNKAPAGKRPKNVLCFNFFRWNCRFGSKLRPAPGNEWRHCSFGLGCIIVNCNSREVSEIINSTRNTRKTLWSELWSIKYIQFWRGGFYENLRRSFVKNESSLAVSRTATLYSISASSLCLMITNRNEISLFVLTNLHFAKLKNHSFFFSLFF